MELSPKTLSNLRNEVRTYEGNKSIRFKMLTNLNEAQANLASYSINNTIYPLLNEIYDLRKKKLEIDVMINEKEIEHHTKTNLNDDKTLLYEVGNAVLKLYK